VRSVSAHRTARPESRATILIAEDEPRISSLVRKGLSANGFSVKVASNSASAYAYARSGEFDLMVLDIGGPGMDGITVLRRLRPEGSSLPVVALTARSNAADAAATLESGADDRLPKPFRFEDLLARVQQRLTPQRAPATNH
jgi:two-component system, OmpR family, copper resistance phosphate regulon response regulator CusR